MKSIFFVLLCLGAFISHLAQASRSNGLVCHLEGNDHDLKPVRLIHYEIELIRLRFTGLEPDRYFSLTGKGVFTQFATKKNTVSPLVNKVEPKSTLMNEVQIGGETFTWSNGKETKKYICQPE
ncbi:MAG: hypothetical protein ACXWQO_03845 [Bdellovibrionota bacterium]